MRKLLLHLSQRVTSAALLAGICLNAPLAYGQCRTLPQTGSFKVNGNAAPISETEFRLTNDETSQAGSIWFGNYLNLESDFNLEFEVFLGHNDGGADGIAFVLQQSPEGTAAMSKGGGLGYRDITPSLTVEYDTWQNTYYNDPPMDHIGLQKNGDVKHNEGNEVAMATVVMNMEDGKYHPTRIQWTAHEHRLRVYWDGNSSPVIDKVIHLQDEIFGTNPYVYWGWTGSTGDAKNLQKVKMKQMQFTQVLGITANLSPSNCAGATGAVDITVMGGVAPFTYAWTNGATTQDLVKVGPEIYSVIVTDACGNVGEGTYTVTSDVSASTIRCPANIVVDNTPGVCGNNSVSYPMPTLEGGCEGSYAALRSGYPSGGFFDMGENLVTYQVVAPDGSTGAQCSFTVTVR